jgi:hypothetical protein
MPRKLNTAGVTRSPIRRAIAVDGVHPQRSFQFLHRLNVEIDGDGLAV